MISLHMNVMNVAQNAYRYGSTVSTSNFYARSVRLSAIICITQWTFRYWHCAVSISESNIWNCEALAPEFCSNVGLIRFAYSIDSLVFKIPRHFPLSGKTQVFFCRLIVKCMSNEKKDRRVNTACNLNGTSLFWCKTAN